MRTADETAVLEARSARTRQIFVLASEIADGKSRAAVELLIDGIAAFAVCQKDPGAALRWAANRLHELASNAADMARGPQ